MEKRAAFYFKLSGSAFFFLFAGVSAALAQSQWRYEVNQYGLRKASIEQKSIVLGSTCSTHLKFTATQDRGKGVTGTLSLEFTVFPASSINGFDFEYFHGVGAPVGGRKLMSVTVINDDKRSVYTFGQTGFWSGEVTDGFAFQTSDITRNKRSQVRELLDHLRRGAHSIEIAVTDGRNHAIVLSATFPLSGSTPVFKALLEGI